MTYGSKHNDENDDRHPATPFLTRLDYIVQMTSQSIADGVIITRQSWREHVIDNM